jgi:hypothetical protein
MNKYKAIKVDGKRYDEHRYLIQKKLGKKLPFNTVVHHIDEDKSNNSLDNLQTMSRSKHAKLHLTGRVLPVDHIDKISKAQRVLRTGAKLTTNQVVEVKTMLQKGDTLIEIARMYNVRKSVIAKISSGRNSYWL